MKEEEYFEVEMDRVQFVMIDRIDFPSLQAAPLLQPKNVRLAQSLQACILHDGHIGLALQAATWRVAVLAVRCVW